MHSEHTHTPLIVTYTPLYCDVYYNFRHNFVPCTAGRVIQSCPWVGLTHGLDWVEIFQFLVGWVWCTIAKVLY